MKRGFSLTLYSAQRLPGGDPWDYQLELSREYPGEYMVEVTVAGFTSTGNDMLELLIRGGGINLESNDPSDSYKGLLTIIPGYQGGKGVFYTNGIFRGPISILWLNPGNDALDVTDFPEHSLYLHFTSLCD